jgi:hypothetical protein
MANRCDEANARNDNTAFVRGTLRHGSIEAQEKREFCISTRSGNAIRHA